MHAVDQFTPFLIVALLFGSAFASSSETAFFSLNRFQLRRIRERYRHAYDRIRTLLGHPTRLLIMILLINELVNLSISTIITELVQHTGERYLGPMQDRWLATTFISMAISIPVLLFFGEITPKVFATKMSKFVAIINSKLLMVIYRILFPFLWILDAAVGYSLRKFKAEGRDHLSKTMSILSEEDFMILMEQGHREGTVEKSEKKLIKNVFEFDDSSVEDVMTPIQQAFCIQSSSKISEVLPEIRIQKYSRVPVYQKTKRKIVGVLYLKDLLDLRSKPELANAEVKHLMTTQIMVVGPNTRLSVLFRRLKDAKTHMAIVQNDNDDAIGVVTMEDLLESIFGEIADERDMP